MEGGSSSSSDKYAERCALTAELARVLDTVRQLEAHMGRGGPADDGGERCRALVSSMRCSVDRSIHIAMSCCVVPGAPESPPSADSGGGLDDRAADDSRCRAANAAGQSKKRKTLPRWNTQVRVNSVQDVSPLEDGFSWRKYGQKDILGAKYPRAYFRCTHRHTQGCSASKQVQRTDGDPLLFDVVYHGNHTCAQATATATHCSTIQSPRLGESWQPQPAGQGQGQEQSPMISVAVGFNGTEGGAPQGLLEPAPFSFPSKPEPAAGPDAASNDFPEWTECQVSGAKNVPDVELASSTANSPIGDMEFMLQLAGADFLDNSRYF